MLFFFSPIVRTTKNMEIVENSLTKLILLWKLENQNFIEIFLIIGNDQRLNENLCKSSFIFVLLFFWSFTSWWIGKWMKIPFLMLNFVDFVCFGYAEWSHGLIKFESIKKVQTYQLKISFE